MYVCVVWLNFMVGWRVCVCYVEEFVDWSFYVKVDYGIINNFVLLLYMDVVNKEFVWKNFNRRGFVKKLE